MKRKDEPVNKIVLPRQCSDFHYFATEKLFTLMLEWNNLIVWARLLTNLAVFDFVTPVSVVHHRRQYYYITEIIDRKKCFCKNGQISFLPHSLFIFFFVFLSFVFFFHSILRSLFSVFFFHRRYSTLAVARLCRRVVRLNLARLSKNTEPQLQNYSLLFKDVASRTTSETERTYRLIEVSDSDAVDCFHKPFASKEVLFSGNSWYVILKPTFTESCENESKLHVIIAHVSETRLHPNRTNLLVSMKEFHRLFENENFDEVDSYWLRRRAGKDYFVLGHSLLYWDAKSWKELGEIFKRFVTGVQLLGRSHRIFLFVTKVRLLKMRKLHLDLAKSWSRQKITV